MGLRETAMLAQVQLLPQASERQWRSRVQMALPDVGKQRGGPQAIHIFFPAPEATRIRQPPARAMLQLCVGLLGASAGTRNWPPTSLVPGEHAPATEPDDPSAEKKSLSVWPFQSEKASRVDGDNESGRGEPGAKCWDQCGGNGKCQDFCGRPGQWAGLCCELQALGSRQPEECQNRGCIGYACCVQDWSGPAPEMNEEEKAAAAEAKKKRKEEEANAEAEKKEAEKKAEEDAARAEEEAKAEEAKAADVPCTVCGFESNCCTAGGSWEGLCPEHHSYELGHTECKKLQGREEAEEKEATKEEHKEAAHEAARKAAKEAKDAEQAAKEGKDQQPQKGPNKKAVPGQECFQQCGKKAGRCPSFCGVPGIWSGSCCKNGAVDEEGSDVKQTAKECENRGCSGFHCCVIDDAGYDESYQDHQDTTTDWPFKEEGADGEAIPDDEPCVTTEACNKRAEDKRRAKEAADEKKRKAAEAKAEKEAEDERIAAEKEAEKAAAAAAAGSTPKNGVPGSDCWQDCGKMPGECDWCGQRGAFKGSCCKLDAEGDEAADECTDRGCQGFHCCVSDAPNGDDDLAAELEPVCEGTMCEIDDPDDWGQQQEKELKVDGPEKYQDEHATADATFISGMSRRDLHHMFKYGHPSNNLAEVGLTIHCFDGTEDYAAPWMPCHDERQLDCSLYNEETGKFKEWWSTSIINDKRHETLTTSGIVFAPQKTQVLCSWENDMGSLLSGCRANNVSPLPPTKLKDMLQHSMNPKYDSRSLYNEVLINSTYVLENLPHSIAAIVYFDDEEAKRLAASNGEDSRLPDKIVATTAYVGMLDRYGLTEEDLPLLKINRTGAVSIMDVSLGARKFLANHSYEQYRKNHPFKNNSRAFAEHRRNMSDTSNMEVRGDQVVTCEKLSGNRLIWGDKSCSTVPLRKALADAGNAPPPRA